MPQKIKVLIAVDGSESAMDAVRYAGGFFDPGGTAITLMHVLTVLPDLVEDLKKIASAGNLTFDREAQNLKLAQQAEEMMQQAQSSLEAFGYEKDAVEIKIARRDTGVAKDITAESGRGYDLLVVGRRGIKDPTETIVGATAYQMLNAADGLPVVIVGTQPDPDHVLIGFDGSENAFKAVDTACSLISRPGREVVLCHVSPAANIDVKGAKAYSADQEKQWSDEQSRLIGELMDKAKGRLADAGFSPESISNAVVDLRTSRAATLSITAQKKNCGTIVIGRRGLSMIRDFMIGRVTMKVLHRAHELAVWVV